MSTIVALTAQNTVGVTAIHELPPEFVTAQLEAVFDDIGVDAAKTGMLFSARLIETVAEFLAAHPVPLVVDPVMIASSGAKLLRDDAVEALVQRLFPLAAVVTPNAVEASALVGVGAPAEQARRRALRQAVTVQDSAGPGQGNAGCPFAPRCPSATDVCRAQRPPLRQLDGRLVACHHAH